MLEVRITGHLAQRALYHVASAQSTSTDGIHEALDNLFMTQLALLNAVSEDRWNGYQHGFILPSGDFEDLSLPLFTPVKRNYAQGIILNMSDGSIYSGQTFVHHLSVRFKDAELLEKIKIAFDIEKDTFVPIYAFELSELVWYNRFHKSKRFARKKEVNNTQDIMEYDLTDVMNNP